MPYKKQYLVGMRAEGADNACRRYPSLKIRDDQNDYCCNDDDDNNNYNINQERIPSKKGRNPLFSKKKLLHRLAFYAASIAPSVMILFYVIILYTTKTEIFSQPVPDTIFNSNNGYWNIINKSDVSVASSLRSSTTELQGMSKFNKKSATNLGEDWSSFHGTYLYKDTPTCNALLTIKEVLENGKTASAKERNINMLTDTEQEDQRPCLIHFPIRRSVVAELAYQQREQQRLLNPTEFRQNYPNYDRDSIVSSGGGGRIINRNGIRARSTPSHYLFNNNFALLTQPKRKRSDIEARVNQDRALFIFPLHMKDDNTLNSSNNYVHNPETYTASYTSSSDSQVNYDDDGAYYNKDWFLGLFDGHGTSGHIISQHLSYELPLNIFQNIRNVLNNGKRSNNYSDDEDNNNSGNIVDGNYGGIVADEEDTYDNHIKSAIRDAILTVDKNLPQVPGGGGSTGITCLKLGKSLYISNVGDSSAFIFRYKRDNDNNRKRNIEYQKYTNGNHNSYYNINNYHTLHGSSYHRERLMTRQSPSPESIEIIYSTKPHNPDVPAEKARIEDAGGSVIIKPFPHQSRVRVNNKFTLAMSRSFGDIDAKEANLVINEPTTDVIHLNKLFTTQRHVGNDTYNDNDGRSRTSELQEQNHNDSNNDYFLVAASDGLTSQLSPIEIGQYIANSLYLSTSNIASSSSGIAITPLELACSDLIKKARRRRSAPILPGSPEISLYDDDVTIAVTKLII